jgi:tetratricopeptide (TPR) repeat protein
MAGTVALAAACATAPPVVTAPVAPRHPEFVFPAAPATTSRVTLDRLTRGWRLLQADDFAAADREFGAVLSTSRDFAPARAAAGYLELARRRVPEAIAHFDAASPAARPYAPALVGRGLALLDARREEDALASFEQGQAAADKRRRIRAGRG